MRLSHRVDEMVLGWPGCYSRGVSPLELARLASEALGLALWVSIPVLLTAASVGWVVGMVQSATQIHEPALQYVPKFVGIALALVVTGGWMSSEIAHFAQSLWLAIPELIH